MFIIYLQIYESNSGYDVLAVGWPDYGFVNNKQMVFLHIFVSQQLLFFYFQNIFIQCRMWRIVGPVEQIFDCLLPWTFATSTARYATAQQATNNHNILFENPNFWWTSVLQVLTACNFSVSSLQWFFKNEIFSSNL